MSSKFKGIFEARQREADPAPPESNSPPSPAPATEAKVEAPPKVSRSSGKRDEPKKRGRPSSGKRSDNYFTQVTAYIREDTHRTVKILLLDEGETRDFSDLVEELLAKWVKSRT